MEQEGTTAGASETSDVQAFQQEARKRQQATTGEELAGVLSDDPNTQMEADVAEKMSG